MLLCKYVLHVTWVDNIFFKKFHCLNQQLFNSHSNDFFFLIGVSKSLSCFLMAFYPEATFLNCFCISREDLLPLKYQTIRITVYLDRITVYLLFTVFYYLTKPNFPITIRNLKELKLNSADGLFQNKVVLLTWCFLLGCHICLICVVMSFQFLWVSYHLMFVELVCSPACFFP